VAVAQRKNLPEHEVEEIRQAALLHDVGKIGIPSASSTSPARSIRKSLKS
jgi:HD-GYP domain-containing protein (c-di-GMP phosphodiesterase class II)